jgi:hypothetical protein
MRACTRQPQGIPRINSVLAQSLGIVALFDTVNGIELISGAFSSARTTAIKTGTLGRNADFSGSAIQEWSHRPAFAVLGDLSIIALLGKITGTADYGAVITKNNGTNFQCPYELRLSLGGNDSATMLLRANTSYSYGSGAFSPVNSGEGLFAVTHSVGGAAYAYSQTYSGGRGANYLGSLVEVPTDSGASSVFIGTRSGGQTHLTGSIYYVALANRVVTAQQISALMDAPWSVYEAQPQWLYTGMGSGSWTPLEVTG